MNDDFKLKKTRIIVVASILWVVFSFFLADTGYFARAINFNSVKWDIFFVWVTPVWVYWAYYWIKKGR